MTDPIDPLPPPSLESRLAALEARVKQNAKVQNENFAKVFDRTEELREGLNKLVNAHNDLSECAVGTLRALVTQVNGLATAVKRLQEGAEP